MRPPVAPARAATLAIVGVVAPKVLRYRPVNPADEAPLVATLLTPRRLAGVLPGLWDRGEAVLPLDPAAPVAATRRVLESLRPTHLLDDDGLRQLNGGLPVHADVAAVVATSGTTGKPKGVELTRRGAFDGGRAYAQGIGVTQADHWLGCLPMHHVAGLAVVPRSLATNVPATIHDEFDVEAVGRAPRDVGATIVLVVPTMLRRLLDADIPLGRYRLVLVGAGPLPDSLRDRCADLGISVVNTYGMTEAWGGVAFDGIPIPGVELKVDEHHEVCVRGTLVMRGYRLRPDLTAQVLDDEGWYHTGDVGEIDDGVLRVTDRRRDIVKSGGVSVGPSEVEHALEHHPDVADVCIVGADDEEWGERVVACVVPTNPSSPPTLEELRAWASERISREKLPRELRLVDAIPRSVSGKPRRHEL